VRLVRLRGIEQLPGVVVEVVMLQKPADGAGALG